MSEPSSSPRASTSRQGSTRSTPFTPPTAPADDDLEGDLSAVALDSEDETGGDLADEPLDSPRTAVQDLEAQAAALDAEEEDGDIGVTPASPIVDPSPRTLQGPGFAEITLDSPPLALAPTLLPEDELEDGDIGVEHRDDAPPAELNSSPATPTMTQSPILSNGASPQEPIAVRRNATPVQPLSLGSQEHLATSSSNSRSSFRTPSPRRPTSTSLSSNALSPNASAHTPLGSPRMVSPRVLSSPRFRTIEIPHTPVTIPDEDNITPDDGVSAPFESISLDAAPQSPPPVPRIQTIPADPTSPERHSKKHSKHESWGGYGVDAHGKPVVHGVLPVHSPVKSNGSGAPGGGLSSPTAIKSHSASASTASSVAGDRSTASTPVQNNSGSSTPRRHAPPAHPHPFPIPTSPVPHGAVLPQQVTSVPSTAGAPAAGAALGVKGSNTLDKFLSRTRPSYLPPKDKSEDETHLHEWEHMMAKSRDVEIERRKQEEAERLEKERRLIAVTPRWEALLNQGFTVEKIRSNESNRKLWFEGAPEHLRGKAWSLAIGNALAMRKDAYNTYLRRAKKALEHGRFPHDILEEMETGLDETFPTLHIFQKGRPLREDLKELLCAWVVYRSDDGLGYAPYIHFLGAMFLLVSPPQEAFLSLCNLLARPCVRAFYTETSDEIDAYYRVFENLQADTFPKIYANCKNLGLKLPESYFRSLLVEQVPFNAVCRLWDQIMLDGDGYIFRAALAIFGLLEPRLHYPDRDEIESVLEGRNAATQAIQEREMERARLRGEQYEENLDGRLSVFGLNEKNLFEWIEHDGWRESRFERLVVRELPD